MDFCMQFEQLRENLVNAINQSGLTVGGTFFVLKDVYNEVALLYKKALDDELAGKNITTETEEIPLVSLENETGEPTNVYVPVENLEYKKDTEFLNINETKEEE